MRVALAALLFFEPDLLLLDEPSDPSRSRGGALAGTVPQVLSEKPSSWSPTSAISSTTSSTTFSHSRSALTLYPGNYDAFARLRSQRRAQEAAFRQRGEGSEAAYVDRWRFARRIRRAARSRLKALARMQPIEAVTDDASLVFELAEPQELSAADVRARRRVGRLCPAKPGVVGAQSAHRSRRPPRSGRPQRQRQDDAGATARRPAEAVCGHGRGEREVEGRCAASDRGARSRPDAVPTYGASAAKGAERGKMRTQFRPLRLLGRQGPIFPCAKLFGRRARPALACAPFTHDAPQIIILDEPTNHLDVEAATR